MNLELLEKLLKKLLLICFIIFLVLYITNKMGYNEYKNSQKAYLTSEKIKQFEKDIARGKDVTIKDYLPKEISYQNKLSKIGLKISDTTSLLIKNTVQKTFKTLSKLGE